MLEKLLSMEIFSGEEVLDFHGCFKTDQDCLKYLADLKWSNDFTCVNCKNNRATVRPIHSRCCTGFKHVDSPGSETLFHKVKFGLLKSIIIGLVDVLLLLVNFTYKVVIFSVTFLSLLRCLPQSLMQNLIFSSVIFN